VGKLSDEELISIYCKNHDPEILGTLYKPYMYLVYGVCMKYLKNREDSQDAVMQIFEVLVKDIPRFEIRNFRSWLYGVTRNYCLMYLRRNSKQKDSYSDFFADLFMESTVASHPIEEETDGELFERLKACMEKLKEEQRICVEHFYYKKQCYKEIATELNIGEQKVKSFIQNGKRNLKICLETKEIIKNAKN